MRKLQVSLKVYTLSHIFLFLNLTLALIAMRLPDLLHFSLLRFGIYILFLIGFVFGILACFKLNIKFTLCLCFFICSIFIHAAVIFYLPSFKNGIAFQNYRLQESFSANFAISQTRLCILYPALFIFPIIALYFEGFSSKYKYLYAKIFIFILAFCLFINDIVILIQGLWNLNFLANGSGSSLSARRAPGLLQDSGESSVIYSLSASLIFVFFLKGQIFLKKHIFYLSLFVLLSIISGFFVNSRIFWLILISILAIYFIVTFYRSKIYYGKKWYHKSIFLAPIFVIAILYFISNLEVFSKLKVVKSYFSDFLTGFEKGDDIFFSKYDHMDKIRSQHLRVMYASIKDHFFTGTGLGSFHENLLYYRHLFPKTLLVLDLPTNLYFGLVSELGIVGLFIIFLCLILIAIKIKTYFENKKNIINENQFLFFVTHYLPLVFVFPLFICFLVGYNLTFPGIAIITLYCIVSNGSKFVKVTSLFCLCGSIYLLSVSGYFLTHIPRVPAFRWAENNMSQIPVSVGDLPQPEGKTTQEKIYFTEILKKYFHQSASASLEELKNGQWLKFNNELLLFRNDNRIFLAENLAFPREIFFTFINAQSKKVAEERLWVDHSGWFSFKTPKNLGLEECYININIKHFCSYKIKINKNYFSRDLFFIEDKYLFGK